MTMTAEGADSPAMVGGPEDGARIKRRREAPALRIEGRKRTQLELAQAAGVSVNTIARLEQGHATSEATMRAVEEALTRWEAEVGGVSLPLPSGHPGVLFGEYVYELSDGFRVRVELVADRPPTSREQLERLQAAMDQAEAIDREARKLLTNGG